MRMYFKQRLFSWFDSYDIYDEQGNTLYVVKGQLSWGHCLKIFDKCINANRINRNDNGRIFWCDFIASNSRGTGTY